MLHLTMKRFILCVWGIVFGVSVYSQKLKDTLFFVNGSMVVGEVKGIKVGVLTFDPDDANNITVQLRKIRSLVAISKVFRVETINHEAYFGRLRRVAKPNHVLMEGEEDSVIINLEDISILYPFKNAFLQRFSGSVQLGFDFTKSSGLGRLNYDGKLNYTARKEEISFSTSGIYTLSDSSFSRDREDITLKYNHYFSPSWFATVLFGYQRNLELGLERRYQEGLGVGSKFITSKHVYAWTRGGLALNQERSTENVNSGTLAELFVQLQFNFFRFTKPEVSLSMAQAVFYSLSQSGRIRNDGQTDLNWEIIKDLRLTFTFYNNYDSRPPNEGSQKFDFGTVLGVSLTF